MSTKANIILKSDSNPRREIILYQHTEGHPNHMNLFLTTELRDLYTEFKEHGDIGWFMSPGRVAGSIIARSVPLITNDTKEMVKGLPSSMRIRIESSMMLGYPTIIPDTSRDSYSNYEYHITLKENYEEGFFGYILEVHKMLNGRKLSDLFTNTINFSTPIKSDKPTVEKIKSDTIEVNKGAK